MTELENNLDAVVETALDLDEGQQPDSKSEKGDAKPVKQGSSDAESIESGKLKSSNLKKILLTKQLMHRRKQKM